ncbi:ABC transporter permease [Brevibacterium zhoupengii]|uniref:ABC transporter permease n=1 Tax=Brevibacterium zhoupengii TaxID=2898795 RepID=UPI0021D456D8|nr:ABC transporter permease [Brevibacterium zhoupengii]
MRHLHTEFMKLRRSLSWPVVVLLPLIAVASGAIGTLSTEQGASEGWHTLWIRSIGFYGMALLPVGIAILAALVWRVEHRNGNWNALMSGASPTWCIVVGKAGVVAVLAGIMQVALLLTVIVFGTIVFGLPRFLPWEYFLSSILVIIACVPIAAIQSGLSMFIRSFAAPVAIALAATGISTVALLVGSTGAVVSPYALATYATQLGTSLVGGDNTSFDAASVSLASASLVIAVSALSTFLIMVVSTFALNRVDTRV